MPLWQKGKTHEHDRKTQIWERQEDTGDPRDDRTAFLCIHSSSNAECICGGRNDQP